MTPKPFILKVQVSMPLTGGPARALLYDQKRDVMCEMEASADILELMAGEPKAFFEAYIDDGGLLRIEARAAEQEW